MLQFDDFKKSYGEMLHRWGLRDKRADVLKFASCAPEPHRGIGAWAGLWRAGLQRVGASSAHPLRLVPRVRRLLLPLPQSCSGDAVSRLQTPVLPVRRLPRGRARLLQLLPELWPRRPHQPHDGLVPLARRVSGRLRLPLSAAELRPRPQAVT